MIQGWITLSQTAAALELEHSWCCSCKARSPEPGRAAVQMMCTTLPSYRALVALVPFPGCMRPTRLVPRLAEDVCCIKNPHLRLWMTGITNKQVWFPRSGSLATSAFWLTHFPFVSAAGRFQSGLALGLLCIQDRLKHRVLLQANERQYCKFVQWPF